MWCHGSLEIKMHMIPTLYPLISCHLSSNRDTDCSKIFKKGVRVWLHEILRIKQWTSMHVCHSGLFVSFLFRGRDSLAAVTVKLHRHELEHLWSLCQSWEKRNTNQTHTAPHQTWRTTLQVIYICTGCCLHYSSKQKSSSQLLVLIHFSRL